MAKTKQKIEKLEQVEETQLVEVLEVSKEDAKSEKQTGAGNKENSLIQDFENLAMLLNTTVESLKKEFYLTQIKKIMSKMQKAVVRYDMTEAEMDKIFLSASQYGLGGITVAPAYLQNCVKQNKKNKMKLDLCSIIDFPFGESSLKGKISDIKESLKIGANTVAVAMPSMLFNGENFKELKKQCKTLYSKSKKNAGIVINATDISEEKYTEAIKFFNKSKLCFITLAFGDATLEEVKSKIRRGII